MKSIGKRIYEGTMEWIFRFSGGLSILCILLISLFLVKEGVSLFRSSSVENGYVLLVNASNPVKELAPEEVRRVYDYELTNWKEVGWENREVVPFRLDEIFSHYTEEDLGEDYALLPEKLEEYIKGQQGIVAFIPEKYVKSNSTAYRVLPTKNIAVKDFFAGKEWMPTATPVAFFGLLPLLLGTLWISLLAILIALPLGLGVAIYMSELASPLAHKFLRPAIELLAAIPSVVYGFFGLVVIVPIVQQVFALDVGETAFTASLILALMAIPTIVAIAEDAMRSTPLAVREASLALGATHWQTIYRVVVPYAKSGIMAAVVLGIGRAIGETMAVLMLSGNAAVIPHGIFEPVRSIPATLAAELGEAPSGGTHYKALFLLGTILFLMSFFISLVSEFISKKRIHRAL